MATIKEMKEKIMSYGEISEEMIDNLSAYQFVSAYNLACEAEKCFNQLSELFGVNIFPEEDCGCGGCEVNINEAILETLDLDTVVAAFDDLAGDETALVALIAYIVEEVNGYEMQ